MGEERGVGGVEVRVPPRRRGFTVAGWIAGLAIASLVGFLATNRWTPDESAVLLDDLPVIENLDVYSEADSVEFLEELRASGLLDEEMTDVEP